MSTLKIESARTSEAGAARQEVLLPYLERLCFTDGQLVTSATELRLGFSLDLLDLDPWDRQVLESAAAKIGEPSYSGLMAEGVAFQAKCHLQLQRAAQIDSMPPQERLDLGNEFIVDAAVGIALLEELQRDINQLIADGEMDGAKRLTAFRHKLSKNVQRLKDAMGEPAFQMAEARSGAMISNSVKITSEAGSDIPAWARRSNRATSSKNNQLMQQRSASARKNRSGIAGLSRRMTAMVGLGGGLLVVWAVAILPMTLMGPRPIILSMSDLTSVPTVTSVTARPPSLFVTVDATAWEALSRNDRLAQIEKIGAVAERAFYGGVHVTQDDGTATASWTVKRGARLLDTIEGH